MKTVLWAACWIVAAILPWPATAAEVTETDRLLVESGSASELRSRLATHARQAEATAPAEAGAAHYYLGLSFERSGQRDSAIVHYRRAIQLRREGEERVALADALLARRTAEDVTEALRVMRDPGWDPATFGDVMPTEVQARIGWGQVLAGHPDSATATFSSIEPMITLRPQWRYRVARAAFETGDHRKAFDLLVTLAAQSRQQDADVMKLLNATAEAMNIASRLPAQLARHQDERDRGEQATLARMKAQRLRINAHDDFPLGAVLVKPAAVSRPRAAVVYMAPGDTIAHYDSIASALTRSGYAVLFLDLRGSGWSVGESCPLPDTWEGREEPLQLLCARDLEAAMGVLAEAAGADTSRCLLGAVGATAGVALRAAELDRRVKAALLVSPRAPRVEHGVMRARVARLQIPIYFQQGPEDLIRSNLAEELYQAGNRGASRMAESRTAGHGPRQFYYDPAVTSRFTVWLAELKAPAKPARSPQKAQRKG